MISLVRRWAHSPGAGTERRILSAAGTVALMTLAVKLVAMGKEMLVASRLGAGEALDAFLLALALPLFLASVIGGSLNVALIPTFVRVREREGAEKAHRLLSAVVLLAACVLLLATVLLALLAPLYLPLIGAGFSPANLDLTRRLLYLLAPVVALKGVASLWGAAMQAGERFAFVALVPCATPMLVLLTLPLAGAPSMARALALCTLAGSVLELALLGAGLRRARIPLMPRLSVWDADLRTVLRQLLPTLSGALLLGTTTIVDQAMAARLDPGSVAALSYGQKLVALPLGLGAGALGTAVVPYFSRLIARQDGIGADRALHACLRMVFLVAVPATMVVTLGAHALVSVVYQRGAFSAAETSGVAAVLAMFGLQIPFYLASVLVVRLMATVLASHVLFLGNVISVVLNVSLNWLFMRTMGVAGIALSTSCVYLASFLFTYAWWCRRQRRRA